MAKNDTKTIFNVLSAKARKKKSPTQTAKRLDRPLPIWLPKFRVATGWVGRNSIRSTAFMTSTAKI